MAVDIFKLSGSVSVDTGKAEANLRKVDATAKQTRTSLAQTEAAGKKAGQGIASGFNNSSSSAAKLGREVSELGRKLSSMKAPSLNFGGAGGSGGGFNVSSLVKGNLITSALSMATGGLTDALKQGWSAGIEYNKMLEKANISFTTLLGTTGKAQEHLKALQVFGESTPFEFPDLIKASQRMQAMGFAAADIIPTLRNVGDAVSAVGGGKEELDGVVMALGQMQTKGKVSAEEMNQLAERGIPAWDLLAKAIGKTKEETIKLSESGRLNGGRAVQGITAMMGERFGGQMDKMSGTLEGRESNFNDILQRRLGEAAKGNTEQLKNAYAKGTEGMATSAGEGFAKRLDSLLTKMGADVAPLLEKFASGEYFMQGINAISFGEKAAQSFNEGDAKGLITNSAQALGMKQGNAGSEQTASAIADSLKQKPIFSQEFDAKLISWITGALQKTEAAARAGGKLVGIGTGESIKEGTATALDARSPSRVMMALGQDATEGFIIGYESGKKRIGSVIDAEEVRKKTLAELEKLRDDPRIKAMLDTIAKAEGTGSAYNMQFGGGRFDSLADHPNEAITRKMGGKSITSTAAGRYQFLNRTWSGLESQLGLKDFSAKSQDLGAIQLMKQRGMIDPIMKGDISGALTKGNREWASLPGSPYGQPTKSAEVLTTAYNAALEKYNGLMGNTSGLLAQMNALYDQAAAKLSTLVDQAKAFVGLDGNVPAASIPKAIQQQAQTQTVQGGQLATATTTAKADILTLSKDAAAATVAMSIPLKEIPAVGGAATEALKTTTSQAGMFADAIMETGKAAGEAIDHLSHFKDAFASGFDQMFDDILDGKKTSLKDFGKQLFKGFLSSTISSATGGKATSPGGMLSNMLFGGGSSGGSGGQSSGGDIGSAMTGGFAGGNPAQAALGGGSGGGIGGKVGGALDMAQNVGGMLGKGGALSKIPGLAKTGGFLGKIPGMSKLGSLFGMGGGGAAAGAAGASAAGGAAGGGGIMGALMPGLMSNPFTAVAGIALAVGVPLLSKLFAKDPLKDYKKHIKAEYGIDASKQMLQKVFEIGQSKFGKDAPKRQIETVRLPEVRDMLSEYAGAFMKGGNNKLFDSKIFGDQFSAVNQFKVKMLHGGRVPGETRGYDHVPVLMDGGEQVISNAQQRRGGGWTGKAKAEIEGMRETLASLTEVIGRLRLVQPGAVLEMGMRERPGAVMQDVRRSFDVRDEHSVAVREAIGTR